MELVDRERGLAEDLAERARPRAALQLELEHPLAGDDVALRARRVDEVGSVESGDGAGVEVHRDGGREAGEAGRAKVRELAMDEGERGGDAEREEQRQESEDAEGEALHPLRRLYQSGRRGGSSCAPGLRRVMFITRHGSRRSP